MSTDSEGNASASSAYEVDLPLVGIQFRDNTSDEAKLVALDYWDHSLDEHGRAAWRKTVACVAKEYSLPQWNIAATVSSYCYSFAKNSACRTCAEPLLVTSRSGIVPRHAECVHCRDEAESRQQLQREATLEAERDLARRKSECLSQWCTVSENGSSFDLDVSAWDFADVLGLDLLLANAASDGSFTVPPSTIRPFAFDGRWIADRLKNLRAKGVLLVHPSSPLDAFDWEVGDADELTAPRYYPTKCVWYFAGRGPLASRAAELLGALMSQLHNSGWPHRWAIEALELTALVLREEAQRYYEWAVDVHDLPPLENDRQTNELARIIKLATARYALGQVCAVIWSIAKDGAAATQRNRYMSRQSATTHTLHRIEQYLAKALDQQWDLTVFREQSDCALAAITLRLSSCLSCLQ